MLIKGKKDILKNLRTLNKEYQKAKHSFIKASEFKGAKPERKKKWEYAEDEYENYLGKIYGKDIDALGELGEIYSHLAQLADTEEDKDEYYNKAISQFETSLYCQRQNPWHNIRIAENYIKLNKKREALTIYLGLLDTDKENEKKSNTYLTCLINAGILAVRTQDKDALNKIIKSMEEYHPDNKVLSQLRDCLDRLKKGEKGQLLVTATNEPIITKGTAKNLQWLSQWNGVLLLLLVSGGATKSQIKEKWLDNSSTTELIVRTMLEVGRGKSTLSGLHQYGNFASHREGTDTTGSISFEDKPIIKEKILLGTNAIVLTEKGMEQAKGVKELVEKALKQDIKLDPKFGPTITSKLVDRYVKWKNTLNSEESGST